MEALAFSAPMVMDPPHRVKVLGLKPRIVPRQATTPVMQLTPINALDCLAIGFFFYVLASFRDRRRQAGLPYPPGPPSWPIVGNLFDVPKDAPWSGYTDMSKKYGRRNIFGARRAPVFPS